MSQQLIELMKLAKIFTLYEKLSFICYLIQRLQHCEIKPKPSHNFTEIEGIAPNLLGGMDFPEYVTRIRRGDFPDL